MDDELLKKIEVRLAELPDDIRSAIQSADLDERIKAIGTRHHLHVDQMGALEDEIYLIMLAFEDPSNFSNNLVKNLHIYAEEAEKIAEDIGAEIFVPLRKSMRKFSEEQRVAELDTKKASTTTAEPAASTITKISPPQTDKKPPLETADMMLSQKVVSIPAQKIPSTKPSNTPPPPAPQSYKTDPYREPAE